MPPLFFFCCCFCCFCFSRSSCHSFSASITVCCCNVHAIEVVSLNPIAPFLLMESDPNAIRPLHLRTWELTPIDTVINISLQSRFHFVSSSNQGRLFECSFVLLLLLLLQQRLPQPFHRPSNLARHLSRSDGITDSSHSASTCTLVLLSSQSEKTVCRCCLSCGGIS